MLPKVDDSTTLLRLITSIVLAAVLPLAGCGGGDLERSLNVGVSLDLPESLPVGSPVDIGYTWTPVDDFIPPADDYRVFVHLVDPDGAIVEQDDHFPSVPTSQWRAGEPVSYRRLLYPPPDLQPEYLDFYVGLYDIEDGQVATLHDGDLENRPLLHTSIIRLDDQRGLPVYFDGWYARESSLSAGKHHQQWQWMRKTGEVAFGNPRGPATLHFRARSPIDFLGTAQTITLRVQGEEVMQIEKADSVPFLERIEIAAEVMGDEEWIELTIEVDNTFVPMEVDESLGDERILGLQVFWLYLAPSN